MQALSETMKYAVGIGVFFVVSLLVILFTFYYLNLEGSELASQMEVVGKSQLMQERHSSVLALVKQHETEHQTLASHLLTESETINFLTEIESLAKKMDIRLTTNSLTALPLSDTDFQKIDLQLNLRGKKGALIEYLTILETLPYYSRITALDFRTSPGETSGAWMATVTLMVGLQEHD